VPALGRARRSLSSDACLIRRVDSEILVVGNLSIGACATHLFSGSLLPYEEQNAALTL
jgi:hypothetical protein